MAKIREEYIGSFVYSKKLNRQIQVNEDNAGTLLNAGFNHLFILDNELIPKVEKVAEDSFDEVSGECLEDLMDKAANNFKGMKIAEIRKRFDELDIEYPAGASKKELKEILIN